MRLHLWGLFAVFISSSEWLCKERIKIEKSVQHSILKILLSNCVHGTGLKATSWLCALLVNRLLNSL